MLEVDDLFAHKARKAEKERISGDRAQAHAEIHFFLDSTLYIASYWNERELMLSAAKYVGYMAKVDEHLAFTEPIGADRKEQGHLQRAKFKENQKAMIR